MTPNKRQLLESEVEARFMSVMRHLYEEGYELDDVVDIVNQIDWEYKVIKMIDEEFEVKGELLKSVFSKIGSMTPIILKPNELAKEIIDVQPITRDK